MNRTTFNPELLTWVRKRSVLNKRVLTERLPKFSEWEVGELQLTCREREQFMLGGAQA